MDWYRNTRAVRFWWQRRMRGWSDDELWSLDHTIAMFILPRLRRFRDYSNGHPGTLTEQQWLKKLDDMIYAFSRYEGSDGCCRDDAEPGRYRQGMAAFAMWFGQLWD